MSERVRSAQWSKARDDAMERAVQEIKPSFIQCPRCRARSRGRTAGVLVDGTRAEDATPAQTSGWTARVRRVFRGR